MMVARLILLILSCIFGLSAHGEELRESQASLKVPHGCVAKQGTPAEPYTGTTWAKEIIHEKSGIALMFVPGKEKTVPFYIWKYEVTFSEYRKVDPSPSNGGMPDGEKFPIVNVDWDDAQAFCDAMGLRLPTSAEWERACRAGSKGHYCFGKDVKQLDRFAWFSKNSKGKTHPVGERLGNPWGIGDMHGNVWEWCNDARGESRVCRGGGWSNGAKMCRADTMDSDLHNSALSNLGFRVALSLEEGDLPPRAVSGDTYGDRQGQPAPSSDSTATPVSTSSASTPAPGKVVGQGGDSPKHWTGLRLRSVNFTPNRQEIQIQTVTLNTPAYQAGLKCGDLVLKVNGQTAGGVEDAYSKMDRASENGVVSIDFERGGYASNVEIARPREAESDGGRP